MSKRSSSLRPWRECSTSPPLVTRSGKRRSARRRVGAVDVAAHQSIS
jgi:hypothetical protein